jgi:predicted ester cyclase
MPAERDKAVVERFVEEVMNAGNLDAADELIDSDHVNHDPTAPEVVRGPEGVKELISMYRAAFPDIRFHTGEIFADGEGRVAHRWTFTGTHEGEMMGVEPTGEKVEVSGVEINHVRRCVLPTPHPRSHFLGRGN